MKEAPKDLNIDNMKTTLDDIIINLGTLKFYLATNESKELIDTLVKLKTLSAKAIQNLKVSQAKQNRS